MVDPSDMDSAGIVRPPADRWASRIEDRHAAHGSGAKRALHEIARLDLAVYRAIATTPTPTLDGPLHLLSSLADQSKLWLMIAGAMYALGGREARRAAVAGVAAIGINSAIVNVPIKLAGGRARPDRDIAGVPAPRRVPMPASPSFPSGHSASGFAFASAVAGILPWTAVPLRSIAAVVGYSRVHVGVHYPGDVLVGALIGSSIGEMVARFARARRSQPERSKALGVLGEPAGR